VRLDRLNKINIPDINDYSLTSSHGCRWTHHTSK
jgi:hypothetical protein